MAMIKFRCPHCKKILSVRDHLAGKKANCPACKKPIRIPTPGAPKAAAAKPGGPEEAAGPSEAELEQMAMAALGDEPGANGAAAEPAATIDFLCEFCEKTIQAPRTEAGKRMQCPNPECRGLVKVPNPKEEKPKDWRELTKKGPAAAILNQPEKIDDAAWGTHTDSTRAHKEGLIEAGAIELPPAPSIGPRGWIRRGLWTVGIVAGIVLLVMFGNRVRVKQNEKDFINDIATELPSVKDPLVRAELYRAIGEYQVRDGKPFKALDPLKQARASAGAVKGPNVDRDLLLADLALTMTEVGGGNEFDENAKERYQWKTLREEFGRVFTGIQAPEAKAIALRVLITRLLEKEQYELAAGLASELSNKVDDRFPPAASQLGVLLLLKDKSVEKLGIRQPNLEQNEAPDRLSRVSYAEYHARKGSFDTALKIATLPGDAAHQVEACIGVAQVLLSRGKDANKDEATRATATALEIMKEKQPKLSPWVLLQTVRAAARVNQSKAAYDLAQHKLLPADFRPRALLEIALAELDQASTPQDDTILKDVIEAQESSPAVDFGWEALAKQNARLGNGGTFALQANIESNQRFRPMIRAGVTLGTKER